ncbi:hypothetical protein [Pandoraea pnomenusa]|nr:hypothetical protein [Pandoraea pnomenusa]
MAQATAAADERLSSLAVAEYGQRTTPRISQAFSMGGPMPKSGVNN